MYSSVLKHLNVEKVDMICTINNEESFKILVEVINMRRDYTGFLINMIFYILIFGVITSCSTGSKQQTIEPQILEIISAATLDGWVESNGSANSDMGGPLTGDFEHNNPGVGYRQFFSFGLSDIPDGTTIISASLELFQTNDHGNPFTDLGDVVVDHLDYGETLDGDDYNMVALTSNIGTLSDNTTEEYKILDVTTYVQTDYAATRDYSQYRVWFSVLDNDNDGVRDSVSFTDAEDSCCSTGNLPKLVVVYE